MIEVSKTREMILKDLEDELNQRYSEGNAIYLNYISDLQNKYDVTIQFDKGNEKFIVIDMKPIGYTKRFSTKETWNWVFGYQKKYCEGLPYDTTKDN